LQDVQEKPLALANQAGMETIPVLFDTDIGSDIDDAVALAYLLRQPRCELLGITTVSGEPDKRASIAEAVCLASGRGDVPVHVGLEHPLLTAPLQPHAAHAEVLAARTHKTFANRPTAVDFLRETIRARPGEITLLATGPFTNLGVLFALDPEIPTLLKQLVVMGGVYYGRGYDGTSAEWNIRNDPHAAALVFNAPVPRLVAVGLDVTMQCQMRSDEVRTRFTQAGPPLDLVLEMAEVWFRHTEIITFHDPLAAALIFEPSLCNLEWQHIEVELTSPRGLGQTYFQNDAPQKLHEIAVGVQAPAFFQHYFEMVGQFRDGRPIEARRVV
jgi:purine nucleosidase